MSGRKEGVLIETKDQGASLVDVISPLMKISIAGSSTLLKGSGSVCRGMVRIPGAIHKKVYERADEMVSKEVKEMRRKIEHAFKIANQHEAYFETPRSETTKENVVFIPEIEEIEGEKGIEELIEFLAVEKKVRECYEKKKGLRNDVSEEIKAEIEKYKEMRRGKEKEIKKREEKHKELERFKNEKKKRELLKKINEIYSICSRLKEIYPDVVAEVKKRIGEFDLNRATAGDILRLKNKYKLDKKLAYIQSESIRENLLGLVSLRLKYEAAPFSQMLDENKRNKFYEKFKNKRLKAEADRLKEGDFEELKEMIENHRREAEEVDKKKRFKQAKEKTIIALKSRGYETVKGIEQGEYYRLRGIKADGKETFIRILNPEESEESQPIIKLEINENGYSDNEVDKWMNEGRSLARELESLGIVLDFKEVVTHFKGKIIASKIEEVKKKIEEKGKKEVEVRIEENNYISINGSKLAWRVGTNIDELIARYSQVTESEEETEKKMLREEE